MDTHDIVNESNTNTKIDTYTKINNDLSLDRSGFLLHNGFTKGSSFHDHRPLEISDLEMMPLQSVGYTSLKNLLPAAPPAMASPKDNSSYKIPIKNPLVKQAALAYLQPMSSPPEVGGKGLLRKLKEKFCSQCECFEWIYYIVFSSAKEVLWERREEEIDEEDEDDEGEEKLD